jgi:hypothetical protein
MPLGKPDITKFDSNDDSIRDARPEIQTAFTSLNTIIDEYNANGDTFGSVKESYVHEISGSQTVYPVDGKHNIFRITTGATITLKVWVESLQPTGSHFLFFDHNAGGICNVELEYDGSGTGKQTFQLVDGGAIEHRLYEVIMLEIGYDHLTVTSAGGQIAVSYNIRGTNNHYYYTP